MPIFLFFGDDLYSHSEKLKFWQKEFEKKYGGDMNIAALDGEKCSALDIFQAASSIPFLSEKRLTIVKNFLSEGEENERTACAALLEKIPEFSVLIFSESAGSPDRRTALFKKIQKIGKPMEFPNLTGSKLLAWIEKGVQDRGGKIEAEAAILLTELAGNDLYRLENEIAKLVGFAQDRPVNKSDIELLTDTKFETSIFRFTDGIGQKNEKLSISTLHHLIESGEELHRILSMIMRQFRIILTVKDLIEQGMRQTEITAKVREHPFVISNAAQQARNFTFEQLRRAYELLIEMDTKLKTGGIKVLARDNREFVLALDRLVLELCH